MRASSLLLPLLLLALVVRTRGAVDFNRDVQPILAENCYHCHGPDEKARKAKLRLDRKEGALGKNEDGLAIVAPGKPAESELITRIFSTDPDELMPAADSNRKLTAAEKQMLKQWVEEGAPWAEHWAFVAPVRPEVPRIGSENGSVNPIDAFVLKKLAEEKLTPSREAAPEKIVRRMTLDLTGLPPTLEEVDAFVKTRRADEAIGKLADRLLASPRYGERMVWEWLDAARYADTNGYQNDPTRTMWYWRDWAIHAFNDNMPFDRFTIEQLAGDLLPEPTREQLIATGFHRNHMINGEGGRIPEESRVEYVQDRVETTGTVWMGLTLTCCRCHDHKFDPIKQREYYQLSAFFNSIEETGANDAGGLANPIISFASPEDQKKIADRKATATATNKEYAALEQKLRAGQPQWEAAMLLGGADKAEATWQVLAPRELSAERGTQLTMQPDGSIVASGQSPETDEYVLLADTELGAITGFKIEALPGDSLAGHGPGRAPDGGNFVLTEIVLQASGQNIVLGAVDADFAQRGFAATGATDGNEKTGWAIAPETGKPHTLTLETRTKIKTKGQLELAFRLGFHFGHQHTLGRFKLYATTDNPALFRPVPEEVRFILAQPSEERSEPEMETLTKFYLDTNRLLAAAGAKRDSAKKALDAAEKSVPRTMVMHERAKPRDTFILVKGAYDKFGDKVAHGTPAVLPALAADAPPDRLALARWLVSPQHPLTARVTVNRLWQMFFGQGLVKTTEDFGVQGDKPTHPELLDWLAREFIESGWDVKHMVRLIVTSAPYRQESGVRSQESGKTPDFERDPDNHFLARGPRYRLPSWMLRDQALAVSGLLVERVGGPPVKVYQPANVWEDATFGKIKFAQDHGEALYRRSLYIFWRRIVAPTLFFDTANRQQCAVKVGRTNTPLHALVTLNDITYVEAARALAERMLRHGGASDTERLAFGFRLCTARAPRDKDAAILASSLAKFRQQYAADPEAARALISTGESKPDASIPASELAAHTSLALLLLNLDETLTKE